MYRHYLLFFSRVKWRDTSDTFSSPAVTVLERPPLDQCEIPSFLCRLRKFLSDVDSIRCSRPKLFKNVVCYLPGEAAFDKRGLPIPYSRPTVTPGNVFENERLQHICVISEPSGKHLRSVVPRSFIGLLLYADKSQMTT